MIRWGRVTAVSVALFVLLALSLRGPVAQSIQPTVEVTVPEEPIRVGEEFRIETELVYSPMGEATIRDLTYTVDVVGPGEVSAHVERMGSRRLTPEPERTPGVLPTGTPPPAGELTIDSLSPGDEKSLDWNATVDEAGTYMVEATVEYRVESGTKEARASKQITVWASPKGPIQRVVQSFKLFWKRLSPPLQGLATVFGVASGFFAIRKAVGRYRKR